VSGAENGGEPKIVWSGAWQKSMERERSAERDISERERSGERDESAAHSPLKPMVRRYRL